MRFLAGQENIFGLADADSLRCLITFYRSGLSFLRVTVVKQSEIDVPDQTSLNLVFSFPHYFSGPFGWQGANFCVASDAEKLTLLDALRWLGDSDSADDAEKLKYAAGFYLFVVMDVKSQYQIQILASDAYREEGASE